MLPFNFVRPVCCGHLAFGNVLGMAGFESFVSGGAFRRTFDTLLTESDEFHLVT